MGTPRRLQASITSGSPFEPPGWIGSGRNSGFQALNLAIQFGANPILFLGLDMRLDAGSHWHGDHPPGLNNPNPEIVEVWRRIFAAEAPRLKARGIDVVNCSPGSALDCFEMANIEDVG